MSGARRVFAGAVLAVALLVPATAIAASPPAPTSAETLALPGALDGILLTGCGDVEETAACSPKTDSVPPCESLTTRRLYALQRLDWMWAPFRLADWETSPVKDLNKILVPYSIAAYGDLPASVEAGLRARHFFPNETLTRPGPVPYNLVTCNFEARVKQVINGELREYAFQVTITGTLLPFPSRLVPVEFVRTV